MPNPLLSVGSLGDLGQLTLPELNRLKIVDISAELQNYLVMGDMLTKESTVTVESGKSFTWEVMVNDSGTAANVGLGYQDKTSIVDTTVTASADWRHSKTDWGVIGQELQMNQSPARIVDLRLVREKSAMIALTKLMESNFFGNPVAITDAVSPWSINTWIVKNATEGFNGGAPSGYTTIGLNPSTYSQWKNYTALYTTVDDTDFVRKLNKAIEFVNWRPPVDGLPLLNTKSRYKYFTNYGLIGPLQELLKASNDNIGLDVTRFAGAVVLNKVPLVRVPQLEADTTNPLYGLDLGAFRCYRLKNWWMRRTEVPVMPGHHTVAASYVDCTYQYVMVTRRSSFVFATAATYPS